MRTACRLRVLLAAVLLTFAACTKPAIVEWDIRTGIKLDDETGFYAYKTSLPPQAVQRVHLQVSSADSILGRQDLQLDQERSLYPALAYRPDRQFIEPRLLEELLGSVQEPTSTNEVVELGYFMKALQGGRGGGSWGKSGDDASRWIKRSTTTSPTKGVVWATPTGELSSQILESIEQMQSYAAAYGAQALVEIRVFSAENNPPYGGGGVYVTARAVVFPAPVD